MLIAWYFPEGSSDTNNKLINTSVAAETAAHGRVQHLKSEEDLEATSVGLLQSLLLVVFDVDYPGTEAHC